MSKIIGIDLGTTDGVVLPPSGFGITTGWPASNTETQLIKIQSLVLRD